MKKIFLAFGIVFLLISLVACNNKKPSNYTSQTTELTTFQNKNTTLNFELTESNNPSTTEYQPQIEATNNTENKPRYMTLYENMISDYKTLINFRLSEQFNNEWCKNIEQESFSSTFKKATHELGNLEYRWSNMIVELINSENNRNLNDFGYILHDINDDNIPELFWVRNDYSVVAIFTYQNDSVVILDSFWSRYCCFISQDGKIYCYGSNGAADGECSVYSLTSNAELEKIYGFSSESNRETQTIKFLEYSGNNMKEISQDEYNKLLTIYPREQSEYWMSINIKSLN